MTSMTKSVSPQCLNATSLSAMMWRCTTWYGTAARQLTTGEYTHDRRQWSTPTHGRAQSCVNLSVGLGWSFGTIIDPRMNVFHCRQQIKGIHHRCNWFTATVIRCSGVRTHLIFLSPCVPSAHEAYRYRLRAENRHISIGETDVLSLTLIQMLS